MNRALILGAVVGCTLIATNGFASLITGVGIESVSSEFVGQGWDLAAIHTVDGSGLNAAGTLHDLVPGGGGNSWQTGVDSAFTYSGTIVFDLRNSYDLASLHVWNLNFYNPYQGRGAKNVEIYTSSNLSSWSDEGSYVFSEASGFVADPGFSLDASTWGSARYVKFAISSNWSGGDNAGLVGLSEVRFFSSDAQNSPVPEPTTMLLLGSGLAGLIAARRKKKV